MLCKTFACIGFLLFSFIVFFAPPYFANRADLHPVYSMDLSIIVEIGSVYLSATFITFSFIFFAMQVNYEYMPYDLFKKYNAIHLFIRKFIICFLLSIGFICLSFLNASKLEIAILALEITILLILLFLQTYSWALKLINPHVQLDFLLEVIRKDFLMLEKKITRSYYSNDSKEKFFVQNSNWNLFILTGLRICEVYIKKYSDKGDYQVFDKVFSVINNITDEYISIKKNTFHSISYTPLPSAHPDRNDIVILESLEILKRCFSHAIINHDEKLIQRVIQETYELFKSYSEIEYVEPHSEKYHAKIAVEYCCYFFSKSREGGYQNLVNIELYVLGLMAEALIEKDPKLSIIIIDYLFDLSKDILKEIPVKPNNLLAECVKEESAILFKAIVTLETKRKIIRQINERLYSLLSMGKADIYDDDFRHFFSLTGFDVPFLIRFSWILDLDDIKLKRHVAENFFYWAQCNLFTQVRYIKKLIQEGSNYIFIIFKWDMYLIHYLVLFAKFMQTDSQLLSIFNNIQTRITAWFDILNTNFGYTVFIQFFMINDLVLLDDEFCKLNETAIHNSLINGLLALLYLSLEVNNSTGVRDAFLSIYFLHSKWVSRCKTQISLIDLLRKHPGFIAQRANLMQALDDLKGRLLIKSLDSNLDIEILKKLSSADILKKVDCLYNSFNE